MQLLSKYEIDLTEIAIEAHLKVPPCIIDNIEVCQELRNI